MSLVCEALSSGPFSLQLAADKNTHTHKSASAQWVGCTEGNTFRGRNRKSSGAFFVVVCILKSNNEFINDCLAVFSPVFSSEGRKLSCYFSCVSTPISVNLQYVFSVAGFPLFCLSKMAMQIFPGPVYFGALFALSLSLIPCHFFLIGFQEILAV